MTKIVEDLLIRENAFKENLDPMGRKLGVHHVGGTAMYECRVVSGPNFGGSVPEAIQGKWTHPNRCQAAIEIYLKEMWDMNDKAVEKSSRKTHAEKVAKKEETLAASTG